MSRVARLVRGRCGCADPRRSHRHRQLVQRARLPGCRAGRDRRAVREHRPSAQPDHDPPDRRRRHVRRQGHRSHRPGRPARKVLAGSYPSGPSSAPSPAIWEMITHDHPGLQRAVRHPVRPDARGRGQAPGRADQGRAGDLRRPEAPGLRHERQGRGRADRQQGRVRRRGAGCSSRPSRPTSPSSAPPRPTSAATSPTSTRAPISAPLDQALAARNNGGLVIAQVKRLAKAGTLKPFAVHVPGRAGRRDRGGTRPDADHADRVRSRDQRRVRARRGQLPAGAVGHRQGDRAPRGAAAPHRLGGQSRLRHLGQRAAHPARGGPARRRHLGDRAGCRRRRAAAGLPVRLLGQCRGDHAVAAAVHLLPGRRLRLLAAVVHADRRRGQRQCLASRGQAACDRRLRRLRRHHHAREADRVQRLLHGRRQARDRRRPAADRGRGQGQEGRARGRARLVQRQARRRAGPGGDLRHRALRDAPDAGRHHGHRAGARDRSRARRAGAGGDPAQAWHRICGRWTRSCSAPSRSGWCCHDRGQRPRGDRRKPSRRSPSLGRRSSMP